MPVFIFRLTSENKDAKQADVNAEMSRLASSRDLQQDASFAISEDDDGYFLQVEGGITLLRCIAMAVDATIQEKADLETLIASL